MVFRQGLLLIVFELSQRQQYNTVSESV